MDALYTPEQIRLAINEIFDVPGAKGAVVAFVGSDARSYLPKDLHGFELVCWPKPGCTSPDALRGIKRDGATIRFADGLHAKVYWSSSGVVLGSANLSSAGLFEGEHYEAAVRLGAGEFDVDRFRTLSNSRLMTSDMLLDFEHESRLYLARNFGDEVFRGRRTSRAPRRSFLDWHGLGSDRPRWKWAPYSGKYYEVGQATRASLRRERLSAPEGFMTVPRGYCRELEWLLCIDLANTEEPLAWLCPNILSELDPKDEGWTRQAPIEAVQHFKLDRRYGRRPFAPDKRFQKTVRQSLSSRGIRTESAWSRYFNSPKRVAAFMDEIAASLADRSSSRHAT